MGAPEALALHGICKRFGTTEVLRGVSLAAREHEVVAILGSSGSGKSTLLRCINLLEMPDDGDIVVQGEAIGLRAGPRGRVATDRRQVERIRQRVAMVFQQFNLWAHMNVLQNVAEAPVQVKKMGHAEARSLALEMLTKVGLADKTEAYPSQLSGGQQQRVAIARALAMQPDILLFDEPTSALDPELVGEVLSVMRALADEGRTMLVVTHEMAFARDVACRVVFLHGGRIEEEGVPSQMFTAPKSERFGKFLSRMLNH